MQCLPSRRLLPVTSQPLVQDEKGCRAHSVPHTAAPNEALQTKPTASHVANRSLPTVVAYISLLVCLGLTLRAHDPGQFGTLCGLPRVSWSCLRPAVLGCLRAYLTRCHTATSGSFGFRAFCCDTRPRQIQNTTQGLCCHPIHPSLGWLDYMKYSLQAHIFGVPRVCL